MNDINVNKYNFETQAIVRGPEIGSRKFATAKPTVAGITRLTTQAAILKSPEVSVSYGAGWSTRS
jgi:hypothetical protein